MSDYSDFHNMIRERINEPGAQYYPDYWWEKELTIILADLQQSMHFILEECSDEELYWLSEVFDDIMDKTRSKEFLACLRDRASRVMNSEWKEEIIKDINDAAEYIDD